MNGSTTDKYRSYFESAISRLDNFIGYEGHGTEGVTEINKSCPAHILCMEPDVAKKNSYCGVDIKEGKLRILFTEGNLGTNINDALSKLGEALNEASSADSMSYIARNSIKQEWDSKVEELQKGIAEQLHNPNVKLTPNWEANFAAMKNAKDVGYSEWQSRFGDFTNRYFEALRWSLQSKGFKDDDMLYEGFGEGVPKGEIVFRIVEKLQKGSYNEILLEDGVLVMQVSSLASLFGLTTLTSDQTTPKSWGTNVDDIASRIIDIL